MARRSGFRPARVAPSRRISAWTVGPGGTTLEPVISASTTQFVGSAIQLSAGVEALTHVRLRGELLLWLQTSSVASGGYRGAFGIGIATLAAVTAGFASVPTPLTEADADNWLYHRFFSLVSGGVLVLADTKKGPDSDIVQSTRIEVDSKAMRKMRSEDAIYAIIEVVEQGVATMNVSFNSRSLVKLS